MLGGSTRRTAWPRTVGLGKLGNPWERMQAAYCWRREPSSPADAPATGTAALVVVAVRPMLATAFFGPPPQADASKAMPTRALATRAARPRRFGREGKCPLPRLRR